MARVKKITKLVYFLVFQVLRTKNQFKTPFLEFVIFDLDLDHAHDL